MICLYKLLIMMILRLHAKSSFFDKRKQHEGRTNTSDYKKKTKSNSENTIRREQKIRSKTFRLHKQTTQEVFRKVFDFLILKMKVKMRVLNTPDSKGVVTQLVHRHAQLVFHRQQQIVVGKIERLALMVFCRNKLLRL